MDKFSNFAMELACRMQGCSMRETQQNLNDFFDLVQGKSQGDFFSGTTMGEQTDSKEAIRRIFNIEYKPISNNNGKTRSNAVADNNSQSGEGGQGSPADGSGRERAEGGEQPNADTGGTEKGTQVREVTHIDTYGHGSRTIYKDPKTGKTTIIFGEGDKVNYHGGEYTVGKRNDDGSYELMSGPNVQAFSNAKAEDVKPTESTDTKQQPIGNTSAREKVETERQGVNTEPTEKQKEAGNYKKGHIKVDGYDITIENPKGSTRSGKDANGKEWSIKMNYDYGYIKGTKGTDGDHIDVYLSDNPTSGNVYVVDQIDQKTGEFDEHKVMYGFPSMEAARDAYKSQYEKGWKVGKVTEVSREDFKKWVESSTRKTKPFSEYKSVKEAEAATRQAETPTLKEPTVYKNNLAGGEAYVNIEGNPKSGYVVRYYDNEGDARINHPFAIGVEPMTAEQLAGHLQKGDFTTVATMMPQPVGMGDFGPIYDQFKGKPKEAFAFLSENKTGDLLDVFHRDDTGGIDLVWGNENGGLAHIIAKHVGKGKDFETEVEAFAKIEDVLKNGKLIQNGQLRYVVSDDGYRVAIRKDYNGKQKNWVVSAIDYNRTKKEKGITTNPTSASHGAKGSELAAPNNSIGKDNQSSSNKQEEGKKNAEEGLSGQNGQQPTHFENIVTPEYTKGVSGKVTERHTEGLDYMADVLVDGKETGIDAFYDMGASVLSPALRFTVKNHSLDVLAHGNYLDEEATNANYDAFRQYVKKHKIDAGIDEDGNPYFRQLKDALDYLESQRDNPTGQGGREKAESATERIDDIIVQRSEWPKELKGTPADVVIKKQDAGKRKDGYTTKAGFVGNDLYLYWGKGVLRVDNAKSYSASEVSGRIGLGVGVPTDVARLFGDAVYELYKQNGLPLSSLPTTRPLIAPGRMGKDTERADAKQAKAKKNNQGQSGHDTAKGRKIDDFGEKIGGSRKDLAQEAIEKLDRQSEKDIASVKNADAIFPKKSILKLWNDGMISGQDAIMLMSANQVTDKLMSALKKAKDGKALQGIAARCYAQVARQFAGGRFGSITGEDLASYVANYFEAICPEGLNSQNKGYAENFIERWLPAVWDTYKEVGNEGRGVLGYVVHQSSLSSWWVQRIGSRRGYLLHSREKAFEKLRALCPVKETKSEGPKSQSGSPSSHLRVVSDGGWGYRIKSTRISGGVYFSRRFVTRKEAEAFLQENADGLSKMEEAYAGLLGTTSVLSVEREGVDYRKGRDVTPEAFQSQFGFRGVEFGNWVTQKERQPYLNTAYDALMDLASILGLSPRAMSLGGRLGMSFGGRGRGGRAAAHYEPSFEVINLTRTKGTGSLAHEWFHAVDNYLARSKSGNVSDFATNGDAREGMRKELGAAFDELQSAIKNSPFAARSQRAGKEYWGTTIEEAARAFSLYVEDKLEEKSGVSPMLTRKMDDPESLASTDAEKRAAAEASSSWPYPTQEERESINKAFDHLFETIQEETDPQGNVVLFQRTSSADVRPVTEDEAALRGAITDVLRKAGIDVIEDDNEGQAVLDMASGSVMAQNEENNLRSGITAIKKIAAGADMVENAMKREDLKNYGGATGVTFYWGETGNSERGYKGGYGLALIGAKHGTETLLNILDVIASGKIERYVAGNKTVVLSNGDYECVLSLSRNGEKESWLLTGWKKKEKAVEQGEVSAQHEPTQTNPTFSRTDLGAAFSDAKVKDFFDKNKQKLPKLQKAYHGSRKDFDMFDTMRHLSEGEGSQAFGVGTYVADQEGLARKYAEIAYNSNQVTLAVVDGHPFDYNNPKQAEKYVFIACDKVAKWGKEEAMKTLAQDIKDCEQLGWSRHKVTYQKAYDYLKNHKVEIPDRNYRMLYEVEIPDDNGTNYLDWSGNPSDQLKEEAYNKIVQRGGRLYKEGSKTRPASYFQDKLRSNIARWSNSELYDRMTTYLGTGREVSEWLNSIGYTGIKVHAAYYSGDSRYSDNWNYVVFNDKDLKITDKIRFFHTSSGEAYGFTVGGKIYIDPRIATAETPLHEYTHLWADAMRKANPKEWKNIVELMKGTWAWDYVKKLYPDLKGDDEIADEALAHFSGRRGAENARKAMAESERQGGVLGKAAAVSGLARLRGALEKFWKNVCDLLHVHFTTAEEVADRVMADMLGGFDPRKVGKSEGLKTEIERREDRENSAFNDELQKVIDKKPDAKSILTVGTVGSDLRQCGFPEVPIEMSAKVVTEKNQPGYVNEHPFDAEELKNLPKAINHPIMVFKSPTERGSQVVLTELQHDGKNFIAAVKLNYAPHGTRGRLRVNSIRSVYPKDTQNIVDWINRGDILIKANKNKAIEWLTQQQSNSADVENHINNLDVAANLVRNLGTEKFFNENVSSNSKIKSQFAGEQETENLGKDTPTTPTEAEESGVLYREVDDESYLNAINEGKLAEAQKLLDYAAEEHGFGNYLIGYAIPDTNYYTNPPLEWDESKKAFNSYRAIIEEKYIDEDYLNKADGLEDGESLNINPNLLLPRSVNEFEEMTDNKGITDAPIDVEVVYDRLIIMDGHHRWYNALVDGVKTVKVRVHRGQFDYLDWHYSGLSPLAAKSADTIVYNSKGEIVPLSERFKSNASLAIKEKGMAIPGEQDVEKNGRNRHDRHEADVEAVNERFNEELQQQIDGTQEKGHVYQLGRPSAVLRSTGFPDAPIELSATRLAEKAAQRNHEFDISEAQNLVRALQSPIAVFTYGNKAKAQNAIVEIQHNGKNFVVGVHFNQKRGNVEVSSIRGLFPKDNAEWLNWITQGKALYIDKEKIQTLINQQRTNLADVDYLDLDSIAKIVKDFENPKVEEEKLSQNEPQKGNAGQASRPSYEEWLRGNNRQREGNGAYTDEDLAMLNDPVAKWLGKSTRTKAQQRAFANRERKNMEAAVRRLANRLHLDNVNIVMDASTLEGRKARAKGFYDRNTNEITIVVPNHRDMEDVMQTLLHEGVAHYGLRQLFGSHFDTFLRNVYEAADEGVRRRIAELAMRKYGGDFSIATEEYLASLAERTDFEGAMREGWWGKIKRMFLAMLHDIGFENFADTHSFTLSDNELRYVLWRSYENLKEPGRYRSILGEAEDVAKQVELKVGNYAPENSENDDQVAESEWDKGTISLIRRLITLSKQAKDKVYRLVLGHVNEKQMNDLRSEGLDVDESWRHSIENSRIIHAQKKHGIADADFEKIPQILNSYDNVHVSDNLNNESNKVVIYEKKYSDGTTYYLEEVRNGRKSLAFQTMYKKGSGNSGGLMTKSSPKRSKTTPDTSTSFAAKVGNNPESGVNSSENVSEPEAWGKRDMMSKAEQVSHGIDPDLLFRDTIEDDNNTARETYKDISLHMSSYHVSMPYACLLPSPLPDSLEASQIKYVSKKSSVLFTKIGRKISYLTMKSR